MLFFDLFRHDPEFIEINSGDSLFKEGDPGDTMYVLIEGVAVSVYSGLKAGVLNRIGIWINGVLFEECQPGTFTGEMAVIDGSARYATVSAQTDCKFAVINRKRFQFLVDESPGFAIDVMRVMAQRLRKCGQRVLDEARLAARV